VTVARGLYERFRLLVHEAAKFGTVGVFAFLTATIGTNLLHFRAGLGPLTANVIATVAGTFVAFFGNRYWTFRHRGRTSFGREYVLFFVLNGVGLLISVACLWFSHYALGLTSAVADNISANVVGLALGTIFRFWSYRRWVFPEDDEAVIEATLESTV